MNLMKIKISKCAGWSLYILFLFITELWSFRFLGGSMRIYYLVNAGILFCFIPVIGKLFSNPITKQMIIFCLILLFVNIFSANIKGSIAASLSLILNVIGAFVVFLILYIKKISLYELINTMESVMLLCIIFGLLALLLYQLTGIQLAFTEMGKIQFSQFQIAGFRTEANTHGKLVCFSIAYCLPYVFKGNMSKKRKWLFVLAMITLIISPTRSATYALILAFAVLIIIYLKNNKFNLVLKRVLVLMVIGIFVYILFVFKVIDIGGYSFEKLNNFFLFSVNELKQDGSGVFRLESIFEGLRLWSQSVTTILFGVGFGQTYSTLQQGEVFTRAGGTELITMLSGAGAVTIIAWFCVIFVAFRQSSINAIIFEQHQHTELCLLSESTLTIIVYIFAIGFTSGTMYVPECWIAFGLVAYLCTLKKELLSNKNKFH